MYPYEKRDVYQYVFIVCLYNVVHEANKSNAMPPPPPRSPTVFRRFIARENANDNSVKN